MRKEIFEELAPVCPVCLHQHGKENPLVLASVAEMRSGVVWHGMLHCSDQSCWAEYPIIDGIPVLVQDVPTTLANARALIMAR
ncbi:MAG: hypothetical protein AAF439_03860, partial [Pseudomonadota bacterium]